MRVLLLFVVAAALLAMASAEPKTPTLLNMDFTHGAPVAKNALGPVKDEVVAWSPPMPGAKTDCLTLVHADLLPAAAGDDNHLYCVQTKTAGAVTPYVPAYLSVYNKKAHVPITVYFRLPQATTEEKPVKRAAWHSVGDVKAWAPGTSLLKLSANPGILEEYVPAKVNHFQTRGHMASYESFKGSQAAQQASMAFVNAFPSFNNPDGVAGARFFDGQVWNQRETAIIEHATGKAAGSIYVVVGADIGQSIGYLHVEGAVPTTAGTPNQYASADTVLAPARVWCAVWDSTANTAVGWVCEHRDHVQNMVLDPLVPSSAGGSATPTCEYVSLEKIDTLFAINPFPKLDKTSATFKNSDPTKFCAACKWNSPSNDQKTTVGNTPAKFWW